MSQPQYVELARRRLEEMVSFFGVNAEVEAEAAEDRVELNVATDATGRLIGHHGETLRALEYLLNIMMKEAAPEVRFSVDIAGYRKARAEQLTEYAKAQAAKVNETGEESVLRPMNPAERRLVHMALADSPEVETESRGEPPHRRIVIKKRSA